MYLNLGNNRIIKTRDIIGIFDMDNATVSKRSRQYLNRAEKEKRLEYVGYDLPKSFVVCATKKGENKVFLSSLSSATLEKRLLSRMENL